VTSRRWSGRDGSIIDRFCAVRRRCRSPALQLCLAATSTAAADRSRAGRFGHKTFAAATPLLPAIKSHSLLILLILETPVILDSRGYDRRRIVSSRRVATAADVGARLGAVVCGAMVAGERRRPVGDPVSALVPMFPGSRRTPDARAVSRFAGRYDLFCATVPVREPVRGRDPRSVAREVEVARGRDGGRSFSTFTGHRIAGAGADEPPARALQKPTAFLGRE